MLPYRVPPPKSNRALQAARPNFQVLWNLLVGVADKVGNDRFKAILSNHANRQEYICRKLGVICQADVDRISKKFQKPIGAPRA
jgi:hypothetical protein